MNGYKKNRYYYYSSGEDILPPSTKSTGILATINFLLRTKMLRYSRTN